MSADSTNSFQCWQIRGMPNSLPTFSAESRLRLQTLTSSTPTCAFRFGIWRLRVVAPAPTMPMRIGDAVDMIYLEGLLGESREIQSLRWDNRIGEATDLLNPDFDDIARLQVLRWIH